MRWTDEVYPMWRFKHLRAVHACLLARPFRNIYPQNDTSFERWRSAEAQNQKVYDGTICPSPRLHPDACELCQVRLDCNDDGDVWAGTVRRYDSKMLMPLNQIVWLCLSCGSAQLLDRLRIGGVYARLFDELQNGRRLAYNALAAPYDY